MRIDSNMTTNSYVSVYGGRKSAESRNAQQTSFMESISEMKGSRSIVKETQEKKAPYSHLAKDGMIQYNGVTFVCDDLRSRICLGDVSNPKNCLRIPMEAGGSLVVNRDNLEELSQAIGMFSPEDVNRIMRAIAQDTKCQQMQQEIEEEKNSIGKVEDTESR